MVRSLAMALLAAVASQSVANEPAALSATIEWREAAVGAKALSDPAQQQDYFGADFSSMGAIPVLVQIQNKGKEPLEITPTGFGLRLPGGETATRYSPFDAAALFVGLPWSGSSGAAALGGVLGIAIALLAESAQRGEIQGRTDDFQQKALKPGVLNPGETTAGFLYFVLETKPSPFNEATLLLPLEGGDARHRELRITEIRFPTFSAR